MCVSIDASLVKVPSMELILREPNPGTMISVEEFPEGVPLARGLDVGLGVCSELAVSLAVDAGRTENIIFRDWVALS